MAFYAAMFAVHGLKIMQAPNKGVAVAAFTANNMGTAPEWSAPFTSTELPIVMQLRRVEWRGSMVEFHAELDMSQAHI